MSTVTYGDFVFSSEDEDQHASAGFGPEEDDSDQASVHMSDEDEDEDESENENENSSNIIDVDEYASFNTDLEKYQYDQLKWNGAQNLRKYKIVKNQKKPKAPPKSKRKSKSKREAPLEPGVEIPKEGEIHFDTRGNLWYSYKKDEIYISERATFHHWIRANLSRDENVKGSYVFPRKRGLGNFNITCFNAVQQHWGLQRPHYAPVMFEWERLNRKDPTYPLNNLYYQGILVIDYWRTPIRNFREIPLVISSAFEGGYMEPATRLHSEMAYEDLRARMPPFLEIIKKGVTTFKALSKASTFSGRSRHFREDAGAISWDKREGSEKIKSYIEDIVKPLNNSTRGSRDLTKAEVGKMRLRNFGTKPGRAKQGTSAESKNKYKADIKRAAGLAPAPLSQQNVEGEIDQDQEHKAEDEDEELELDDGYYHQAPADKGWKMNHMENFDDLYEDQNESMIGYPSHAALPRFVFRCTEAPFLRAMTEEEALVHPQVDVSDPRNHVPNFTNEVDAIRDALQVTIDHFKDIFGSEPMVYEGSNYISEYCNIQDQMDEYFQDDATALRRLGRWEGTIFDWEQAEVEQDPCFGRKQPF